METDFDGNVVKGQKEELIKYIQEGKSIRVGWQLDFDGDKKADLEHWVDATFITILGGEVFTQIDPIYAQGPNIDIPQVEIYSDQTKWTAVIGTNSKLLNRFIVGESPVGKIKASTELSEEEKAKQIKAIEESFAEMQKVDKWDVATFWSVGK